MADRPNKKKRESWKVYFDRVDAPGLKRFYKISCFSFVIFYVVLLAALAVFAVKFLDYCRESFVLYEEAQLSLAADHVLARLNDASAEELAELLEANEPTATQFDDGQLMLAAQYQNLAQGEFTCREQPGYNKDGHSFALYSDGKPVGEFTIGAVSEETRLGLLTITQWEYSGGAVEFEYQNISRSWRVPEGFVVKVNGVPLTQEYITAGPEAIEAFEYFSDYANVPGMVTYSVEGLLKLPDVEILDNLGNAVEFENDNIVELEENYNPSAIPAEFENEVIELAKLWCNYSLRDASLEEIEAALIKGSMLHNQVIDSNRDRNFIDAHTLLGYENETVTEYISYNDNCCACRVHMERSIQVYGSGQIVENDIDMIFYLVRIDSSDNGIDDPKWCIADVLTAN